MPEKDSPCKIKINITLKNTEWLQELPQEKLSVKLPMLLLLEIEFYVKLTPLNSENTELNVD